MKNLPTYLILTLALLSAGLYAQVPQGINYQSVARDVSGNIMTNHLVSVQFAVHDSTPVGPVIFSENQNITTNPFGIFSTVIGTGNTVIGTFHGINWNGAGKFLEILMDFNGGSNFVSMGTSPFMSVPYSLYANGSAGDVINVKYDTTGVLNLTTPTSTINTGKGVWTTGGNAGLGASNFIGTLDNADMILKGHNLEGMRITQGGALLATGNTTTGITPASGAGSRMMWIPAKSAFRAGSVTGSQWDNANVGTNSIALGTNTIAAGTGTIAIGNNSSAMANQANVYGNGLIAKSMGVIVVGSYNDTTGSGSATTWGPNDPLFQVGNGTSATTRGNALTITKAGNISAAGLQLSQGLTLTPAALPTPVNGTTTVTVGSQSFIVLTSSTGTPSNHVILTPGTLGQIITIEVLSASGTGHGITFDDMPATYNMNLNGPLAMGNQSTVTLLYDGTYWVELSHSIN